MEKLKEYKIGTRPFFYPMHLQPVFQKMGLFKNEKFTVAEHIAEQGFYVPSGLGISNEEIETVTSTINDILG